MPDVCHTQTGRLKTREKLELGPVGSDNNDDNQGGDMPSWMFKMESNRGKTKNRDSRSQPRSRKKTTTPHKMSKFKDGKCVAGPVLTRAQAKKSVKSTH